MRHLLILTLAALALAGCASTGQLAGLAARDPTPERPGTKISVRNPNTAKWMAIQMPGAPKGTPMWVCRPLACGSGRAAVAAESSPSPTRAPDRKALEKAANLLAVQTRAQDMMMDAASEGDERVAPLSSRVTDIRGYPAIIAESKRTNRGKASFVMRGELFVGLIKVRLVSSSGDRAEAKRNFDEFVAAMEILDVAPGESAPAADPPPRAPTGPDRRGPPAGVKYAA